MGGTGQATRVAVRTPGRQARTEHAGSKASRPQRRDLDPAPEFQDRRGLGPGGVYLRTPTRAGSTGTYSLTLTT